VCILHLPLIMCIMHFVMTDEDDLHRALLNLSGFLNRPQADTVLLRRAGSSLDRALFPLLIRAGAGLDQMTVSELADVVGRHYSTVSRQVTVLQQQGFVLRGTDEGDRRRSVVAVTEKGREEIARIAAARNDGMTTVFTDWTDQDRTDLTRLLNKLVDSLESAARPGGAPR
jgi:DNA-binding MarR family transcriptional regulator